MHKSKYDFDKYINFFIFLNFKNINSTFEKSKHDIKIMISTSNHDIASIYIKKSSNSPLIWSQVKLHFIHQSSTLSIQIIEDQLLSLSSIFFLSKLFPSYLGSMVVLRHLFVWGGKNHGPWLPRIRVQRSNYLIMI